MRSSESRYGGQIERASASAWDTQANATCSLDSRGSQAGATRIAKITLVTTASGSSA
jgi:hypothetical protein